MIVSTLLRTLFSTFFYCLFTITASAQTVAILDAGINITENLDAPNNRVIGQRCFSVADDFSDGTSTGIYTSLCPNGEGQDLSSASATIPRALPTVIADGVPISTYPLGIELEHGNLVSNALYSFNSTVRHKPVQVFFYDRNFVTGDECIVRNGSPRVDRRLIFLRGLDNEKKTQIFSRSTGTRSSVGFNH